ncbi:MAG: sarcosine oxidase subunit gamma family protein [Aestuariivirga sp.]
MLERRSALATAKPCTSAALEIRESPDFTLIQIASLSADFERRLKSVVGPLPRSVGTAKAQEARTLLRVGPSQFWIVGAADDDIAAALSGLGAVTPLSHSRTRIALAGVPAREVLAKLVPLDFHPKTFGTGSFAMTGLHHTPVLIHCTGKASFDVYALRTFAMSVWDAIADAALEHSDRS